MRYHKAFRTVLIILLAGVFAGVSWSKSTKTAPKSAGPSPEFIKNSTGVKVYCVDRDGDGYGVACKKGRDADDSDPKVNTPRSVLVKYGDLRKFLKHRGYNPKRIFFIAIKGNDRQGRINDITSPFATWEKVHPLLRPGDMVIFRQGRYIGSAVINCLYPSLKGTAKWPIMFLAFPGETVILDSKSTCIYIGKSSHLIFDGFILDNSQGDYGNGILMFNSSNVAFRNIESRKHQRGLIAMEDLHNVLIENSVFHDNPHSHGIYLGSREKPNTNLTIRNCLIYKNGRHGIQHNGRVSNLVIENNVIHSNTLGGISFLQGVSKSFVRNTLIFNNNKQGIVFFLYDDGDPTIKPFDQVNNVIENNLIWIGSRTWDGKRNEPAEHAAIHFDDATAAQNRSMDANVIRKNILVTYNGPVFKFSRKKAALKTIIRKNIIYRAAGDAAVMHYLDKTYAHKTFERLSGLISENRFEDPHFADVKIGYFARVDKFDFSRPVRVSGPAKP